jgi:hypothetical protein
MVRLKDWTVSHPELLKEDFDITANILCSLFQKIWKQEKILEDWINGVLFKLPKKGTVLNCSNCRGIKLLSVISKIFSRIICERIKNGIETKLRREQAICRSKLIQLEYFDRTVK